MMDYVLTKILPLFVYPLGMSILFCILALFLLIFGRKFLAGTLIMFSVLIMWFASTSVCANYLMDTLEKDYPPVALEKAPKADAILILGGMTRGIASGNDISDLSDSADRLFHGAMLYKEKAAPVVIVSGGVKVSGKTEAELMADILEKWGVPAEDILLESRSWNTYQNGEYSKKLMQKHKIKKVLLVTSAYHMKRAKAVFEAQGVMVIPMATDYQVVQKEVVIGDVFPDVESLDQTTGAIREYIAWLYYSIRGWV